MNYKEFIDYLKNISGPDTVDLVEEIDDCLDNYNLSDYLLELDNIIYTNSQASDQDNLDAILETLGNLLEYILRAQGVIINDNLLLSEKLELCNGLLELQDYSDMVKINEIVSLDIPSEEILSSLLSLVTEFETEKTLSLLADVNDSLITVIKNLSENASLVLENDNARNVEKYIERYSKFKNTLMHKEIYSDIFINTPNSIGLPLELYINLYLGYLKTVENKVLEVIGLDLVGMALLSSDEGPVINNLKQFIPLVDSDITFVSRMNMFVTDTVNGIENG